MKDGKYTTKGGDLAYIVKDDVICGFPVIAVVENKDGAERVVVLTHDLKLDPSAKEPYLHLYDPRNSLIDNQPILVFDSESKEWIARHFNATLSPSTDYPNMVYTYPAGKTSFTVTRSTEEHECWGRWKQYNDLTQIMEQSK